MRDLLALDQQTTAAGYLPGCSVGLQLYAEWKLAGLLPSWPSGRIAFGIGTQRCVDTHYRPESGGRGKSNLVKVMLYDLMENDKCGKLVFDPQNEYYGSITQKGLRDHPKRDDFLDYYTIRPIPGAFNLRFNINLINPGHIIDSITLTDPQIQALVAFYRAYKTNWIREIFNEFTEERRNQSGIHHPAG